MAFNLDTWMDEVKRKDILFEFVGVITSDTITRNLDDIEAALEKTDENSKVKRKVYNVSVEAMQNLFHHGRTVPGVVAERFPDGQVFFFLSRAREGHFQIISANFVSHFESKLLTEKMDKLNSLSVEEVKDLYKLVLNNKEFSEKGGGGLGMIDIARKTQNKLQYRFFPMDADHEFYEFMVDI